MTPVIPVGVNLTTIGVSARLVARVGAAHRGRRLPRRLGWDHFVSRGTLTDPVLECWTMLAAAAARHGALRVGSFVTQRHEPSSRPCSRAWPPRWRTCPEGRLELGIGIGGHPREHEAYGITFPDRPSAARAWRRRSTRAAAALRRRAGRLRGPLTIPLRGAHAFPVPAPPPRIIVGAETPAGARLAARIGDAWTVPATSWERAAPVFAEALASAGRVAGDVSLSDRPRPGSRALPDDQPVLADLARDGGGAGASAAPTS